MTCWGSSQPASAKSQIANRKSKIATPAILMVMELEQVRRFHYLYERAAAGLARINSFAAEPETRRYLESLVARAYGEIHETRDRPQRFSPLLWFFESLPRAFRRHLRAFWLSIGLTLA